MKLLLPLLLQLLVLMVVVVLVLTPLPEIRFRAGSPALSLDI